MARFLALVGLLFASLGAGAPTPLAPPAGWQAAGAAFATSPPWGLPPPVAAAMHEFGLLYVQTATWRNGARQWQVAAFRFGDASGAYGAWTYDHPANARIVTLVTPPAQAAMAPTTAWIQRGPWLLRVNAAAPLRSGDLALLAAALPAVRRSGSLPLLPRYLPRDGLLVSTFSEGPAALTHTAPWLAAAPVGFEQAAEVVVGDYGAGSPGGQLAIVSYPTPSIAAAHLRALRAAFASAGNAPGAAQTVAPLVLLHRSGSMIAIWRGADSPAARRRLAAVQDRTVVSWTHPPGIEALPALILGIFTLVGVIIAICFSVGIATGGFRVLLARWFPRRFPLYSDTRFIRLKLR